LKPKIHLRNCWILPIKVVEVKLNRARRAAGVAPHPVMPPPKAAPAIVANLPALVEPTPDLPVVPWTRTQGGPPKQTPSGSGIRPLDAGRLMVETPALIGLLAAALRNPEQPTTVTGKEGTAVTFGPPHYRDRRVSKYCETIYNEPRELWIRTEKQLRWVAHVEDNNLFWLENGSSPWTYNERRLVQQANGSFVSVITPSISRIHWLYQPLFEWNCDLSQPKPSASQVPAEQVVWYYDRTSKQLPWRLMSEHMQAGMRRMQRERGRRLADALRTLVPDAPETQIPEDPEDLVMGLRLLHLHRVTPQSWFNTALCMMLYRSDNIPEETYPVHILDERDPEHAEILQKQSVFRCGLYHIAFPEHFYCRYFDDKLKQQTSGFTIDALQNQCIGIEVYLMYLQTAGLIKIFNDTLEADPYGRGHTVRLIQAAVVRGYKRAQNHVIEQITSGKTSGNKVRHGTHAFTVAAILEAGGPKGSRKAGKHEFTYPGLYTCPDGELSPLLYATRAMIITSHDLDGPVQDYWSQPCAQFVFRVTSLWKVCSRRRFVVLLVTTNGSTRRTSMLTGLSSRFVSAFLCPKKPRWAFTHVRRASTARVAARAF